MIIAELVEFNCVELIYYKMDQFLLQIGASIIKWGNHYYKASQIRINLLQSGGIIIKKWEHILQSAAGITKWDNYYKVGQYNALVFKGYEILTRVYNMM